MEFFISCTPRPKERARRGKNGVFYTPKKTKDAELDIATQVRAMINGAPLEGALSLDIEALMPIPQSWSAKKQNQATTCQIWPATTPDADNLTKAVCDALNGVLWHDDKQIVQQSIIKRYSHVTGYILKIGRPVYSNVIPLAINHD